MAASWKPTSDEFANAYPPYQINTHSRYLTGYPLTIATMEEDTSGAQDLNNLRTLVDAAIVDNPYSTGGVAQSFDIDEDIEAITNRIDTFSAAINALNSDTDVKAAAATAKAAMDTSYPADTTALTLAIDEFDAASELDYLRKRTAFLSMAFELNALRSSTVTWALASFDAARLRDLANYASKLKMNLFAQKGSVFADLTKDAIAQINLKVEALRLMAGMEADFRKMHIVAENDMIDRAITFEVANVRWAIEQVKTGMAGVAASGVQAFEKEPSKMEQFLSTVAGSGIQGAIAVGSATKSPALGVATLALTTILSGLEVAMGN
jgi:hypothetical protein